MRAEALAGFEGSYRRHGKTVVGRAWGFIFEPYLKISNVYSARNHEKVMEKYF